MLPTRIPCCDCPNGSLQEVSGRLSRGRLVQLLGPINFHIFSLQSIRSPIPADLALPAANPSPSRSRRRLQVGVVLQVGPKRQLR